MAPPSLSSCEDTVMAKSYETFKINANIPFSFTILNRSKLSSKIAQKCEM